jgi:hypothetical protein
MQELSLNINLNGDKFSHKASDDSCCIRTKQNNELVWIDGPIYETTSETFYKSFQKGGVCYTLDEFVFVSVKEIERIAQIQCLFESQGTKFLECQFLYR